MHLTRGNTLSGQKSKLKEKKGFSLLEVLLAVIIGSLFMLSVADMMKVNMRGVSSMNIGSQEIGISFDVMRAGDTCQSIVLSGGSVPLSACGNVGVPQTITLRDKNGTPIAGGDFNVRGNCVTSGASSYYVIQLKHKFLSKDPLTGFPINNWFTPKALSTTHFAQDAFSPSMTCPPPTGTGTATGTATGGPTAIGTATAMGGPTAIGTGTGFATAMGGPTAIGTGTGFATAMGGPTATATGMVFGSCTIGAPCSTGQVDPSQTPSCGGSPTGPGATASCCSTSVLGTCTFCVTCAP